MTADRAIAEAIRDDAARLAQTLQAAKRAGLEATVTFQVKEAVAVPRTIGTHAKADLTVTPVVVVRRVEVIEL